MQVVDRQNIDSGLEITNGYKVLHPIRQTQEAVFKEALGSHSCYRLQGTAHWKMLIKQGLNKMQKNDWRNIINGLEIPTVSYSDQPFVVKTDDGAVNSLMVRIHNAHGDGGIYRPVRRSPPWRTKSEACL